MHRDPDADAGPDRGDLLDHLEVHLVGLATAAVLLGVGQPEQPGATERAEHLARERLGGLGLGDLRQQLALRDVTYQLEEGSGFLGGKHAGGRHACTLVRGFERPAQWRHERLPACGRPVRPHAVQVLRPERAQAAGPVARSVAELRHRPPRGDPARHPAPRFRPRRHPLRPGQQLRATLRPGRGEHGGLPPRRLREPARRAGHLHQGGLRHVARAVRPGRRVAQVHAVLARPVTGQAGTRLRRHLLQPPVRPGDAGRGDDAGARHGGALRPGVCTPASRRTPRRRPGRRPRSPASWVRRCSSTSRRTRC